MADTLSILARLRRLQATQAKRGLADALAVERAAEAATARANAALRREAHVAPGDAAHPLARGYTAWLPAGQAAVVGARAAQNAASAGVENARAQLAALRAAENAVAHVCRERADAGHARVVKKQQAALEEAAAGFGQDSKQG